MAPEIYTPVQWRPYSYCARSPLAQCKMEAEKKGSGLVHVDVTPTAPPYGVEELPPPYPVGAVMASAPPMPPDEAAILTERDDSGCTYWLCAVWTRLMMS